jgi:hypothetical protein
MVRGWFCAQGGQEVKRNLTVLKVGKSFTIAAAVFAEPGDLLLLGARSLEGLNLTVDSARRKLVAAGPLPAA